MARKIKFVAIKRGSVDVFGKDKSKYVELNGQRALEQK